MPTGDTQGARAFLERNGLLTTYRNPSPRTAPDELLVHRERLSPPFPVPALQAYLEGSPPPDRGQSLPWPYPDTPDG